MIICDYKKGQNVKCEFSSRIIRGDVFKISLISNNGNCHLKVQVTKESKLLKSFITKSMQSCLEYKSQYSTHSLLQNCYLINIEFVKQFGESCKSKCCYDSLNSDVHIHAVRSIQDSLSDVCIFNFLNSIALDVPKAALYILKYLKYH